jgi:epsilon-lactone hydrolase
MARLSSVMTTSSGHADTTCLAACDAGLPVPAAIVAFSLGLDYTRSGATMRTKEGVDPLFTRDAMDRTAKMYLAGQDPRQPLLSPAILTDLAGFPPMLLQVGTNELLLDDSVRLAERARDAGVDVILEVTAAVPHVFQAFDRAALFLAQHLRDSSPSTCALTERLPGGTPPCRAVSLGGDAIVSALDVRPAGGLG